MRRMFLPKNCGIIIFPEGHPKAAREVAQVLNRAFRVSPHLPGHFLSDRKIRQTNPAYFQFPTFLLGNAGRLARKIYSVLRLRGNDK